MKELTKTHEGLSEYHRKLAIARLTKLKDNQKMGQPIKFDQTLAQIELVALGYSMRQFAKAGSHTLYKCIERHWIKGGDKRSTRHTIETKLAACQAVLWKGQSKAETQRQFNVSEPAITRWLYQYQLGTIGDNAK